MEIQSTSSLANCICSRFNDPTFCDITVEGPGGLKVYCSRFILRCSSEVLNGVLQSACSTFHISKGDPAAIKQMLTFMHGGTCLLNNRTLPELMSLAQRYKVGDLVEACEKYKKHCNMEVAKANTPSRSGVKHRQFKTTSRNKEKDSLSTIDSLELDEFVEYEYETARRLTETSLPGFFLSPSYKKAYSKLVKYLVAWLEHDQDSRKQYRTTLLGKLELPYLDRDSLAELCSSSIVQGLPMFLRQASEAIHLTGEWPKMFRKSGQSEWQAPLSGNYFIVCRGGPGGDCPGSSTEGLGGKGLVVAGTFHLEEGTKLAIRIAGRQSGGEHDLCPGGSACCVGIQCKQSTREGAPEKKRIHVLLVAAGGGGASKGGWGMVNGEDASFSESCMGTHQTSSSCGCGLRGMSVSSDRLKKDILDNACGTMGRPYHLQPGCAGQSYLSRDAKGIYTCVGNSIFEPSISIFLRPSYL